MKYTISGIDLTKEGGKQEGNRGREKMKRGGRKQSVHVAVYEKKKARRREKNEGRRKVTW